MDSIADIEKFERAYIERYSFALFPAKWLDKVPLTAHGCLDAVNSVEAYEALHRGRPRNPAVATGEKSGIWVLDIDPRHGGQESYARVVRENGALPMTWEVKTQSGGLHVYFRWDECRPVANRANILPGIDCRGDGGYVLLPPSRVEGVYEWLVSPSQIQLADAPGWLYNLVCSGDRQERKDLSHLVHGAPDGTRNVSLTQMVGTLLGRGLDIQLAWTLADAYNTCYIQPPLDDDEFQKTFESIASRELAKRERRARGNGV